MSLTTQTGGHPDCPAVSVIVPARNEEDVLPECLDSLLSQRGTSFEIIVADDGSTDCTRSIAAARNTTVVEPGPVPEGWTGKCNAVNQAARIARGKWLLFTDADTIHAADSLRAAVAEAEACEAAMLSYSPRQIVRGLAQRALMPVIFSELAARYRPSRVNDPGSPAAANGQFLLVRSDAYRALGGHGRVAGNLLEDVALAEVFKQAGYKIRFRASAAISTRMYRSLAAMWEGWTKNLALLFPDAPRLAAKRIAEFALISGTAVAAIVFASRANPVAAASSGLLFSIFYGLFFHRIAKAHFSLIDNVLALWGLPLFAMLLIRSYGRHNSKGEIDWKGRTYPVGPSGGRHPAEGENRTVPPSGSQTKLWSI